MSAKVKLISCLLGIVIALGMLVMGVYAATQQKITMQGSVDINVSDRTLYLRDVRVQHDTSQTPTTIPGFRKGYINKSFQLDLTDYDLGTNNTSTIVLYFDIVNLIIDGQTSEYIAEASWAGSSVEGVTFSIDAGSERIDAGTVSPENFNSSTPLSGTVVLEINVMTNTSFDLSRIKLTIREPVDLSDVEYTIGENNEITITSWGDGENIVIPGSVSIVDGQLVDGGDYTVTSIAGNAFTGNTTIKTVTLPDTITSIGGNAFYNCTNLTTINLPEGLTEIGGWAFSNCGNLIDIVFPDTLTTIADRAFFNCPSISGTLNIPASVTSIGGGALTLQNLTAFTVDADSEHFTAIDGILYSKDLSRLLAYPRAKSTENFVMRSEIQTIDDSAFRGCAGLTGTITLSPNLTTIGPEAFYSCTNLTGTLTIPASVTSISSGVFRNCPFSEIIVEDENTAYVSENGVLYNADKTLLVQYPTTKTDTSFIMPETVTSIESFALSGSNNLISLTLSSNLTTIGGGAISECYNLSGDLILPQSVTSIGLYPFYGSGFTSFSIDNDYYITVDGVLYDAAKTRLIQYPAGKTATEFVLPDTVTEIGAYSMRDAAALTSITIPASVTVIGDVPFTGCNNMKTVFVDSPTVAAMLSSKSAAGNLINYATTVYVSESAAASLPASFANIYSEVTPSDEAGYRKYTAV